MRIRIFVGDTIEFLDVCEGSAFSKGSIIVLSNEMIATIKEVRVTDSGIALLVEPIK